MPDEEDSRIAYDRQATRKCDVLNISSLCCMTRIGYQKRGAASPGGYILCVEVKKVMRLGNRRRTLRCSSYLRLQCVFASGKSWLHEGGWMKGESCGEECCHNMKGFDLQSGLQGPAGQSLPGLVHP